ncbi:carbohydrate-binding module family 20 domain-containing protein [Isoptericola dokdonensis]|uniref:Alpha-amylase n=1 Tax=Isoptericola dokdonensis DS-3 TaxID=1300344 RepID=A0A161HPP5_9MICO|nr:carbohydrate-binding module family 20 domain-containing protein [Isoptericola dokdonensis]ANC31012.1 Alpha-amylase precursor [Isoptericola dokdonensis DS-3]
MPLAHRSRTARPRSRAARRPVRLLAALAALGVAGAGLLAGGPAGATTPVPSPVVDSPNGRGNVIANLFQWTWDSVAAECTSSLGPAGYGYVQVSPPQEHVRGTAWWTSYQPVSYRVESKLGTRAEFAHMVETCRTAGVGVVVDAVVNHTTGADQGSGTGVAGSPFGVDSFPGTYSAADFNDCRTSISNYGDRYQVQNCRLLSLQDLRTGSASVRDRIAAYLNDLIGLGVAGFRIDAAKHVPAADLEAIRSRLSDPDVFWVHEVIGAAGEPIRPSEYLGSGDSHEFDYARELRSRFDGAIAGLRTIGDGKLPSADAGVFVDNHDTERNGETMNYRWGAKYLLANTFLLSWPYGSPTVYSGYAWTDKDAGAPGATQTSVPDASCGSSAWTCTHDATEVRGMVGFHNAVEGTAVTSWWDDGGNHIGYGRGDVGYVTINNTASAVTRTYATSLPAGTYCDVVASDDCSTTYTVSASGTFTATVPAYGALALLAADGNDGDDGDGGEEATGETSVAVRATTVWGQDVRLVGSLPELGSWSPQHGVRLGAGSYPVWTATVDLPAGASFEYKFVKVDGSGAVVWENGSNRTATVAPDGTLVLDDTWR